MFKFSVRLRSVWDQILHRHFTPFVCAWTVNTPFSSKWNTRELYSPLTGPSKWPSNWKVIVNETQFPVEQILVNLKSIHLGFLKSCLLCQLTLCGKNSRHLAQRREANVRPWACWLLSLLFLLFGNFPNIFKLLYNQEEHSCARWLFIPQLSHLFWCGEWKEMIKMETI